MNNQGEYLSRRIHSLLGVIPIGLFVVQHLIINHFALYGEESFNKAAGFMGSLPFVVVLEIVIIYLPILFHAILGVYIAFVIPRYNVNSYSYGRNWLFLLQRATGVLTLIFIAWHVWQTRLQVAFFGADVNYQMMETILTQPFYFWFYLVGILAVVFHLANGLWGFCVTFGITQSPKSQRIVSYATVLVFIVVSYIGIRTIIRFAYGI